MNRICNACNIERNENNYLKDRTVCKSCYNKSRRKNNNNILIQNQQPKIDNLDNNNRTLIIGLSNCGLFNELYFTSKATNFNSYKITKSIS